MPFSEQQHMSTTVIRHYLKFISNIKKSNKPVLKQLLSIAMADVRTVTGSNLRNILLKTNLSSVDELRPDIAEQITYKEINEMDLWRIPIMKELVDMKCGDINPPDGWTVDELQQILDFVCTGLFFLPPYPLMSFVHLGLFRAGKIFSQETKFTVLIKKCDFYVHHFVLKPINF